MDFYSYFSDDSSQSAANKFEHVKKFIHWMHEKKLIIKDGIIYDNIYECIKKYICENVMWLLFALKFTHRVIEDRLINTLGNNIIKMDGINGSGNTYFKQKFKR